MKKSFNRNTLWAEIFANQLADFGIKNVCISPGSRNTPLTLAFANNKKFKKFVIYDERSSGFFALGLTKFSKSPTVLITTSGTAVAELYPAIIEAYQTRVPLIVCTADRPDFLRYTGANQTINQHNIYGNHIRWFEDVGLPKSDLPGLRRLKKTAVKACRIAADINKGPVHLNFPFEKPLEPFSFTDHVDEFYYKSLASLRKPGTAALGKKVRQPSPRKVITKIIKSKKVLIIFGPGNFSNKFLSNCSKASKLLGAPILADALSSFRFGNHSKNNLIVNHTAYLRSVKIRISLEPDVILQFGTPPTAQPLLDYFKLAKCNKFVVNKYGDLMDPSRTSEIIKLSPEEFCLHLLDSLNNAKRQNTNTGWLKTFLKFDNAAENLKERYIFKAVFPFEGKLITELINNLPNRCNLMVSNSMPVRDFDFFAQTSKKQIKVYSNRGASGIDGVISTALGISKNSKSPTFLVTGDLAFLYDLSGAAISELLSIPLTIILINNNGGGIFEMLPISNDNQNFIQYFKTPHNFNFGKIVKSLSGKYYNVKSWNDYKYKILNADHLTGLNVIHIKTNSNRSVLNRKKYWDSVVSKIDSISES